jgi:hypothetical protein
MSEYPLHEAAIKGDLDQVRILVQAGHDIDKQRDGLTPLHFACARGHFNVVEYLIEHDADVNAKSSSMRTPLHYATENGHAGVVEMLLARGANPNPKCPMTPLHYACLKGYRVIVEILLKYGADANIRSEDGDRPIDLTKDKSIKALLKNHIPQVRPTNWAPPISNSKQTRSQHSQSRQQPHPPPTPPQQQISSQTATSRNADSSSQDAATPSSSNTSTIQSTLAVPLNTAWTGPPLIGNVNVSPPRGRSCAASIGEQRSRGVSLSEPTKQYPMQFIEYVSILRRTPLTETFGAKFYKGFFNQNDVIVKKMRLPAEMEDSQAISLLQNRFSILSQITHPNIIKILGITKSPVAIVYEYASKGSLNDILHKHREILPERIKFTILKEIVDALVALHSCNPKILHLRLNSSNVLFTDEYHVKLTDIQVSNMYSFPRSWDINTVRYLAPEQIELGIDSPASDVYSFGILAWELCTGRTPFGDTLTPTPFQLANRILRGERPPISDVNSILGQLLGKCWQQQPEKRPTFAEISQIVNKATSPQTLFGGFIEIPKDLICPITMEMIRDPVVSTSGHTYEKQAILKHLETSKTDPITRQPCTVEDLRPNYAMAIRIEEYLKSRFSLQKSK